MIYTMIMIDKGRKSADNGICSCEHCVCRTIVERVPFAYRPHTQYVNLYDEIRVSSHVRNGMGDENEIRRLPRETSEISISFFLFFPLFSFRHDSEDPYFLEYPSPFSISRDSESSVSYWKNPTDSSVIHLSQDNRIVNRSGTITGWRRRMNLENRFHREKKEKRYPCKYLSISQI